MQTVDFSTEVRLARPGGVMLRDRVDRVLAHVFVHQIHHRGQAHAMLSEISCPPPQLDEFLLAGDAQLRESELGALQISEADIWRE